MVLLQQNVLQVLDFLGDVLVDAGHLPSDLEDFLGLLVLLAFLGDVFQQRFEDVPRLLGLFLERLGDHLPDGGPALAQLLEVEALRGHGLELGEGLEQVVARADALLGHLLDHVGHVAHLWVHLRAGRQVVLVQRALAQDRHHPLQPVVLVHVPGVHGRAGLLGHGRDRPLRDQLQQQHADAVAQRQILSSIPSVLHTLVHIRLRRLQLAAHLYRIARLRHTYRILVHFKLIQVHKVHSVAILHGIEHGLNNLSREIRKIVRAFEFER